MSSTKYVVDTHALVWFLEGNQRLGAAAREVLAAHASDLAVSIVTLAEACWIIEHGRTSIPNVESFLRAVDADPRLGVIPLDRSVLDRSLGLSQITEMHDRQIVATALVLEERGQEVVVLTRDQNIRASGLVTVAW